MEEKGTIEYLNKALSIRNNISEINWNEVEKEVKEVIKKHTGNSEIKQEAVLRNISAVCSVRLMRTANNLFEDWENQELTS